MATLEQIEAITLDAYRRGLLDLRDAADDVEDLLAHLGDVNLVVSDPSSEVRVGLAGRLIAAAQISAETPWPDDDVERAVRDWLNDQRAERDDAAPVSEVRPAPEDDFVDNLDALLREDASQQGLDHACWLAASLILQWMVRAPMGLERSLGLQQDLSRLADEASDLLSRRPPHGLEDMLFEELLGHLYARSSRNGPSATSVFLSEGPSTGWLHIAIAAAAAHAEWTGVAVEHSMRRSVARATERLATGRVPDEPHRFSMDGALEHVRDTSMHAALVRLGRTLRPADPISSEMEADVVDGLLEVSSSGLVDAWVAERLVVPE